MKLFKLYSMVVSGLLSSALVTMGIALLMLPSCSNNSVGTQPSPGTGSMLELMKNNTDAENTLRFKVNGSPVTTTPWVIIRFRMYDHPGLNITSNMKLDKRTIQFNLNDEQAGVHLLAPGAKSAGTGYGDYKPNYEEALDSYSFQKGELKITSIDTTNGLLNAEFSGTVSNIKGETLSITEGKIVNGKINPGVINY